MKDIPIAITMGDPSGIGPEIIVKAIASGDERSVVYGNSRVMADAISRLGLELRVHAIKAVEEARFQPGIIDVVDADEGVELPQLGQVNAISGKMSFSAILAAINAAKAGKVSAIVTAPINKESMAHAGIKYPGHTEILADYSGASRVAMMLANDEIRTVLVTIHMSLRQAIEKADFEAQMTAIRFAHKGGLALGIAAPKIAVAGLNPHAGEGGLFGDEETRIIAPAIERAQSRTDRCERPLARRYGLHAGPKGAVRCRGCAVSRSRSYTGEISRPGKWRQYHAGPAVCSHEPGSRNGF